MPFRGTRNTKGRPKGSGKKQGVSAAYQAFLDGVVGGKSRFEIGMERMFNEDLKTFWAYAYGKPIETQVQLAGDMEQFETEKAVARVLALGGIQSPSPEIKTP